MNKIKIINIDSEQIKKYKQIDFSYFCNITQEYILDGYFEVERDEDYYHLYYKVLDGYILISKECKKIETLYKNSFSYNESKTNFKCINLREIILGRNGKTLYIECGSIEVEETIIEYSNCPSIEINENGDYLFKFGRSSLTPKREVKPASYYIEGWDKLSVFREEYFYNININNIEIIKNEKQLNYRLSFNWHGRKLTLYFNNVTFSKLCGHYEFEYLYINKMLTGLLLVDFDKKDYFCCESCKIESCE